MGKFFNPQAVLVDWKDGSGWTLTDALAGTLVTGATGSGKSSGPGNLLRRAFLTSTKDLPGGAGMLVLFAKNGDCQEWIAACNGAGRGGDVIHVAPAGPYRFNILDWIASWGDAGDRGPIPTVALLEEISSAVDSGGSHGDGENAFFSGAHRSRLTYLVSLCQIARLPVSLPLMRAISSSAPETTAQAEDVTWRSRSVCWHALQEADELTRNDSAARADFMECRRYHLKDYPALSSRTKGVVEIMFSSLVGPFLTRPLRPLFCDTTTITPEACFDGRILLIDLPVQEYGQVGKLAALAWKRAFELAVMRRSGPPGSLRPVVLFADECQNFLSPSDAEYQAVARSAGGVTCLLTQQISGIREAMGSEDRAHQLTGNLATKFFCQNTGQTNQWASELIGERYTSISSINVGRGGTENAEGSASSHAGVTRSEQRRSFIEASDFQRLRRGGPANNFLVDAVVFCGGKLFAGAAEPIPFKTLSFKQR